MALYSKSYDKLSEYYLEASRGNVVDTNVVHKFGFAEDIDTGNGVVDIWDGSANDIGGKVTSFNWIDSPIALQISSNNPLDISVVMTVEGLDSEGLEWQDEVTLTGNTPVILEGTWSAVNRVWNSGSVDLEGYVFVSDSGATVSVGRPTNSLLIRAIVHVLFQQTQQAAYTVPSNKTLYLTHGWGYISKSISTEAIVTIWRARPGGVFRIFNTMALQTTGSSGDQRPYGVPLPIQPGTRIVYRAQVYSNSTAISAGFHGVLIKE